MNKETLKLEGWFAPCIANTLSGRYACCGSKWVEIEHDVTIQDVMNSWTCTTPAWKAKEVTAKVYKRTKGSLAKSINTTLEPNIIPVKTPARQKAVKITFLI